MKVVALAAFLHAAAPAQPYSATLLRVTDGDTVVVSVPAWAATPFSTMHVRISGIDTPESRKPPAKCKGEVALGKAATAFAKGLAKPGDPVTITLHGWDKYFRLDADVTLPDGRDWAAVMLSTGMARPYAGKRKSDWCRKAL